MWRPPKQFDEYAVHRKIGQGQMGQVYLGYDTLLAREVAIKFVSQSFPSERILKRFLIEARAAARIQHPNVVSVYRVGEFEKRPFIVSEYVRGKPLEEFELPVPWGEALKLAIDLSRGLASAHRKGVLHRDIKPANAIVEENGDAKLLDFGLAKLTENQAPATAPARETVDVPSKLGTINPDGRARAQSAAATIVPDEPRSSNRQQSARVLTREGALMGTPDFMSPEAWRGEPGTRVSDIYSLGALIYELCCGHSPHAEVAIEKLGEVVQTREPLSLVSVAPDIDPRFAAIVDRCIRISPTERYASAAELRDALEALWRRNQGASIPTGNPYRGLRPFEAAHRALFFGRDGDIGTIVDRLRSDPMVLVAGDSGIGKSSVCRAGVLPAVIEEGLGEGRNWAYVTMTPGRNPLRALSSALVGYFSSSELNLVELLRSDPDAAVSQLSQRLGKRDGVIVFIDQLEELTTQGGPEETEAFAQFIARLARGIPGVRLLATARADFLTRLVSVPTAGDAFSEAIRILQPLSAARIRQVIVGPADVTNVEFESDELVDNLVRSTDGAPGGLPLLQFALAELWEARDQETNRITRRALDEIGQVSGALARHGDTVVNSLRPAERQFARAILVRLVGMDNVRARRIESELIGEKKSLRSVLDALVKGRILVVIEGEEGVAYELAHEVLISGWGTLRSWLQEDAGAREVIERLQQAAAEWRRLDRGKAGLWSGKQLEEARRYRLGELDSNAIAFLEASEVAVRKRRRIRYAVAAAMPLLVGAAYAGAQLSSQAEVNARITEQITRAKIHLQKGTALASAAESIEAQAFRDFDRANREDAEIAWADALSQRREAYRCDVDASRTLEAALTLDHEREDVAALFADVLYRRALYRERVGDWEGTRELVARFELYDPSGQLTKKWSSPASLSLRNAPADAKLVMEKYDRSLKLEGALVRSEVPIPASPSEVRPGSYRIVVERGGRTTRFPFVLGRGAEVSIDLRAREEAPDGLILIPTSSFSFGSTADEESRIGFFDAAPAHPRMVDAFLVSRYEVTFADWIEFLNALPDDERQTRTPGYSGGALTGAVRLIDRGEGMWSLSMKPGDTTYRAEMGQPIRYRSRDRRQTQDWLRFPVTGISAEDVAAYIGWLRSSGKLPSARFCTEVEWEKAARGADAREFPHGNRLSADEANFDQTYGKNPGAMGPDEVGSHAASRSPYGVDDMTGNAFEWTVAAHDANVFVLKGGSYFYDTKTSRVSNRAVSVGTLRVASVGARICADVSGPVATAQ